MKEYWDKEKENLLLEHYGDKSLEWLKSKLGKNIKSIESKAIRMRLGSIANNYLVKNQVAEILGVDHKTIEIYEKKGLKFSPRSKQKNTYYYISHRALINWLKNNECWDSRKMRLYALGEEPKWLKTKREKDNARPEREGTKYTKEEEQQFIRDVRAGLGIEELAIKYKRSNKGIERKIRRLREKWILEKNRFSFRWENEELKIIFDKTRTDAEIGEEIGRTPEAVRSMRYLLRKRGIENEIL